jgi:hypothetical protein
VKWLEVLKEIGASDDHSRSVWNGQLSWLHILPDTLSEGG